MKFIVSRTSVGKDISPCTEAKRDSVVYTEFRTFGSPEAFDKYRAKREGKWLSVGTNHRVNEHGCITRDNGTMDVWMIELNSLEELIMFCNKYGDVIIRDNMYNEQYKEIEIYDDYRE